MTMPVDIDLNLDPSGYISGMRQSGAETTAFAGTLRTTAIALTPLQKAMSLVTPSRAMLAAQTAFVASAARTQQQLSGVQATAAVTGVNVGKLTKSMRDLAKEMPVGNQGSRQIIQGITQMGVAAKGSERTVGELAKTFGRLGGSTGENIMGLTQGMIQLSRTMNTGLNPARVEKMADSLVEVTKATGTSATGVLTFSKAIAPLAQAAGIGQTSVMGISAAFSKMGEDGFAGAMAVNKMLTDLNSSVREGSPQMATYAQIVGKTSAEFESLFKQNPAEALTQVTEAIAKAGPRGQVMLEQLGLEGVRTQRALIGAVQAGDLRGAVASSVSGYGSGANEKAAEAAYGGLSDALTKLRTVAEQAADAMGTPFLGAVTRIVDVAGAGTSGLTKVAESKPAQLALTGLAYAALPALIMAKVIGPLITGLGLKQGATSGPVRSFLGAAGAEYSQARGTQPGVFGRFGAAQEALRTSQQPMGQGVWGRVNERFGAWGAGFGAAAGGQLGPRRPTTTLSQAIMRGGVVSAGFTGMGQYLRMLGQGAEMSRMPANLRTSQSMRPVDRTYGRYFNATDRFNTAFATGRIDAARRDQLTAAAAVRLQNELKGLGGAARQAGSMLSGMRYMGGQALAGGAQSVRQVSGAVLGRIAVPLMSATGLSVAAMVGMAISANKKAAQDQQVEANKSATSYADEYNTAMGLATESTGTFAGRLKAATESIAASAETLGEGLSVSKDTVRVARGRDQNIVELPKDRKAALAMLQLQQSTTGFTAMQGSAISSDLIRQFGKGTAADMLSQLDSSAAGGRANLGRSGVVGNAAGALAASPTTGFMNKVARFFSSSDGSSVLDWSSLSKEQEAGSVSIAQSIQERAEERGGRYSDDYVRQEQRREMDEAVAAAADVARKTGNDDGYRQLVEDIQLSLGVDKPIQISLSDLGKASGFSGAMAENNQAFRENFGYNPTLQQGDFQDGSDPDPRRASARAAGRRAAAGITSNYSAPGAVAGTLQDSFYIDMLRANGMSGNPLESLLTRTGQGSGSRANEAMQRLVTDKAADPSYQVNTVALAMRQFQEAGQSMGDLVSGANQAVNSIANMGDAAHQAAMALGAAAQQQLSRQNMALDPFSAMRAQGNVDLETVSQTPTNADGLANNAAAADRIKAMEEPALQQMRQALGQIREMNVAKGRAYDDYYRQREWGEAAHALQLSRADEDFRLQSLRSTQAYGRQRERAEAAFERQRLRSHRDFGIQMARQAEDFARQTYDPYTRIQVQPTWDVPNLVGNLKDQEDALRAQLANLLKLRSQGVSNAAISLLGLNDPKNAQQAAVAVGDILNSPEVVAQINAAAANRKTLGAELMGDASNVDVKRQTEDFRRGMTDQSKEFKIQLAQGKQDFTIAMAQMVTDQGIAVGRANESFRIGQRQTFAQFATGISRMGQDLQRANEVMVGDMTKTADALQKALSGQTVDWSKMTVSGVQANLALAKDLMGKFKPVLEGVVITTSFQMDQAYAASEAKRDAAKAANNAAGKTPVVSTKGGRNADGGVYVKGGAARTWGEESDEVLLPLDTRGSRFLVDVMQRLTSGDQLSNLQTAAARQSVTYHQDTYTYDHSTHVDGPITVAASDPEEFARKMQAKKARTNLTAPPQRRSGG